MDRVPLGGYGAVIEAAYQLIPSELHGRLRAEFLCGTDPLFAGLHEFPTTTDGRSYRNTPHVAYAHHQVRAPRSNRRTTVVLPGLPRLVVLVHELGHVLHETLAWQPSAQPVSWYAETNCYEAFAEAFTSWLVPGYAVRPDAETMALFEELVTPS